MGAFDIAPNITIPDPVDEAAAAAFRKKWRWDAHEQVIIKGAYTSAEQEPVDNASSGINGNNAELRVGTARTKLLEVMIVDWTFSVNGRKVPVKPQSIRALPANYRKPILDECDKIAAGMTEEEQQDFLSSANGHLPGTSETTSLSPLQS